MKIAPAGKEQFIVDASGHRLDALEALSQTIAWILLKNRLQFTRISMVCFAAIEACKIIVL